MRLIDVDEFKAVNGMKDDCADCDKELRGKSKACEFDRVYTKMDFCGWLDDAPTVDAVPVVHGRWETDGMMMDDGEYLMTRCTACGKAYEYGYNMPFCPNCGADMRKDGDHAEGTIQKERS